MPLKKDPKGGGTNADNGRSKMYCSYCYEDGKFLQPEWSALWMQEFSKEKLMEMGYPGFLAGLLCKGIPRMKRWKAK